MPKLCEKCGTYDPTYELTAESCCPCCGVVYANLPQPQTAPAIVPAGPATMPTDAPAVVEAAEPDWGSVKPAEFWASIAAVGLLFALIFFDDDGFLLLLDGANLAFHEAGHIFFGLLGMTLGLYGGTLGQLVFPIVAGVKFWRQRQAVAFALSGVWLFQNFLNVARYMADARAKVFTARRRRRTRLVSHLHALGSARQRHDDRVDDADGRLARHGRLHAVARRGTLARSAEVGSSAQRPEKRRALSGSQSKPKYSKCGA